MIQKEVIKSSIKIFNDIIPSYLICSTFDTFD